MLDRTSIPYVANAANFAKGLIHGYMAWAFAGFVVYLSWVCREISTILV